MKKNTSEYDEYEKREITEKKTVAQAYDSHTV